ncbi:M23 family metallopeptidase [Microbacterium sp.]|uniref:M23 family metallopeptidase n=1 Tax=Microbacterium sp. TaxID=51671 RepID=UPI0025DDF0B5|nr:M23 family metallopeptidase [Microbacterium sp.]
MRSIAVVLLVAVLCVTGAAPPAAAVIPLATGREGWQWPVDPVQVTEPYRAPAHSYGPGHRGIDLAVSPGTAIVAPAAGVIAFAGSVAGRPLLTIDHGHGLVTTLEPVTASLPVGAPVRAGEAVAAAASGGHAVGGTVHFGVRENGEYINPMLLVSAIPRAVLLPCC